MWYWSIMAGVVITALFLVITLAQIEARTKTSLRWSLLTLCSLAVVTGLIFFKPGVDMKQVSHIPTQFTIPDNAKETKESTVKNSFSEPADSGYGAGKKEISQEAPEGIREIPPSQDRVNVKSDDSWQTQDQKKVKGRVLVSALNVRDKGSPDGQIIGNLDAGDIVEIISDYKQGEWINVKLTSGETGWVIKRYLKIPLYE